MKKKRLIDVLHELISHETAQIRPLRPDSKTVAGKRDSLIMMRKLSKRDAYYRIIHIMRGHDTEFPRDAISNDIRGEKYG